MACPYPVVAGVDIEESIRGGEGLTRAPGFQYRRAAQLDL